MISRVCLSVLLVSLLPLTVQAAWLQYEIATGVITGGPLTTSSDFPTVPGHEVVEDPALNVTTPVWPIPSGCTAGQQDWTKLSPGNVLPLIVRTDLLFFSTTSPLLIGCWQVATWHELKQAYTALIVTTMAEEDLIMALGGLNSWKAVKCVHPEDDANQNCVDWSTQMTIINNRLPGRAKGITMATDIATLITDVFAFKDLQKW